MKRSGTAAKTARLSGAQLDHLLSLSEADLRSAIRNLKAKVSAPTRNTAYDLERSLIILDLASPSGHYPDLVELDKSLAPLPANAKEWQQREPRAAVQGKDGTP
jgi:hypothetical protein